MGERENVDFKDGACRLCACFCTDCSLVTCGPYAINGYKCCCCESQSAMTCGEACADEESGYMEHKSKCCCCYAEQQCPPNISDIGMACCGIQCIGGKKADARELR